MPFLLITPSPGTLFALSTGSRTGNDQREAKKLKTRKQNFFLLRHVLMFFFSLAAFPLNFRDADSAHLHMYTHSIDERNFFFLFTQLPRHRHRAPTKHTARIATLRGTKPYRARKFQNRITIIFFLFSLPATLPGLTRNIISIWIT